MKLSYIELYLHLIFIIINNNILLCKINANRIRDYPESLIKNDSFDKFYVLDIPYCNTNFCKVSIIDKNTLNIRSFRNFKLDKNFKYYSVYLKKLVLRNNFNGMNLFIPKNDTSLLDKSAFKISNIRMNSKDVEVKNKDLNFIHEGIDVIEFEVDDIELPKDPNAHSGYYNNRGIWINY